MISMEFDSKNHFSLMVYGMEFIDFLLIYLFPQFSLVDEVFAHVFRTNQCNGLVLAHFLACKYPRGKCSKPKDLFNAEIC